MNPDYSPNAFPAPTPASPFDRQASAVDELRAVLKRTEALADRLAGPVPTKDGGKPDLNGIAGGGLLDSMERATGAIQQIGFRISEALGRIESRI